MNNTNTYNIYKITCSHCPKVYIGSTRTTLANRMVAHRYSAFMANSQGLLHEHMRENPEAQFNIVLLRQLSNSTKQQASFAEDTFINSLDTVSNGFNKRYETGICEHKQTRNTCQQCGGSNSRCLPHNTIRYQCKQYPCVLRANNICHHSSQRAQCKLCNPYRCDHCDKVFTRSGYTTHLATRKHVKELTVDLSRLFIE